MLAVAACALAGSGLALALRAGGGHTRLGGVGSGPVRTALGGHGGAVSGGGDFGACPPAVAPVSEALGANATSRVAQPEGAAGPSLRVALGTGAFHHIRDGVSLSLNHLADRLEKLGHHLAVFAPGPVGEGAAARAALPVPQPADRWLVEAPSASLPGRGEYYLSLGLGSAGEQALEALRPDVVHVATPDPLGFAMQAWGWHHGVPVVCTYHTRFNSYLQYYSAGILEPAAWLFWLGNFYRGCDRVYVPSDSVYSELEAHGVSPDALRYWARGVDAEQFHPRRRCLSWRRSLGVADDEVLVLMTSRLVWEKGLQEVAGTFTRLVEEGVPFRSVVVGDGPARDGFQALAPDTLFVGSLQGDDLAAAYASADVFFFPSETETFGNVNLEAMASSLPVVASDASGSRMMVRPGETGFLVPFGDLEGYAASLRQLVTDAGLRRRMGAEGRRQAVDDWQWDSIIDGLVRDYYNVTEDTYHETHFNKTSTPNSGILDRGEEILSNPLWGPAIAAVNRAGA